MERDPQTHRGGQEAGCGPADWPSTREAAEAAPSPGPQGERSQWGDKAGDLRLLADPDSQDCLLSISL